MIPFRDIIDRVNEIAEKFHPRKIILFGSYAYGKPNADSDVDLLVLTSSEGAFDKELAIREAIDFKFPVDLLVRSVREFERRIALEDFFLIEIQKKGKVLYEAPDQRVGRKSRGRLRHRTARVASKKIAKL